MANNTLSARDRWYVLGVLTLVYALNIADRFSISTLIEPIRQELHLNDSGIAFLTGVALALFYVTVGIPVAALADRSNRRNILAAAIAIWSAMTALCGLSRTYAQLLIGRFGVGIGEAGGTPPSASILADKFEPSRRPMAFAVFSLGACLGAWLGSSVAGEVSQRYGWRAAFLVLGIPGLIVALLVYLTVREPCRGDLDGGAGHLRPASFLDTLKFLRRQHSARHLTFAISVATLWSWGLMWWTPTFLQRSYHMTVGEAGDLLGPMHLIAGTSGTLFAAWFARRAKATDPRYLARFLAMVTAIGTIPSIAVYATKSQSLVTVFLWVFVPAVYFYIGPVLGLLQNVVPSSMRATVCALALFTANVANLIIAPQFVGLMSDHFANSFGAGQDSLRWALLILAPTGFWAAWHFWRSGRTIREEQAEVVIASTS